MGEGRGRGMESERGREEGNIEKEGRVGRGRRRSERGGMWCHLQLFQSRDQTTCSIGNHYTV